MRIQKTVDETCASGNSSWASNIYVMFRGLITDEDSWEKWLMLDSKNVHCLCFELVSAWI